MKENLHMKKLEAKQIVRPLTFENRDSLIIVTQLIQFSFPISKISITKNGR